MKIFLLISSIFTLLSCNSWIALKEAQEELNLVSGILFRDLNGNEIQDDNEEGMAGVRIVITQEDGSKVYLETDDNGAYSGYVESGNTQIAVDETDPDFSSNHTMSGGPAPSEWVVVNDGQSIGLAYQPPAPDLTVSVNGIPSNTVGPTDVDIIICLREIMGGPTDGSNIYNCS